MYGLRVPNNTIRLLIIEVCQATIDENSGEVIACPTSQVDNSLKLDGTSNMLLEQ